MAINIKIGDENKNVSKQKSETGKASIKLKIRKTLDGNFLISDHDIIDIIVSPAIFKIVALPKTTMSDEVYGVQNKLFDFLAKKGVIKFDSVRGGTIYGALEAAIPESKFADSMQVVLFAVSKFMEHEKPIYDSIRYHEKEYNKFLTNPDEEDSTELGEIPQSDNQGSKMTSMRPFGPISRIYEEITKESVIKKEKINIKEMILEMFYKKILDSK